MALDDATRERIDSLIISSDVVLFMKGHREAPQCGFSATVVRILDGLVPEYRTADVLQDPGLREGLKEYSAWPTIPQLYVRGEFVGGCDIVQELHANGELQTLLGVEIPEAPTPTLEITEKAAAALREAIAQEPGDGVLHIGIDARFHGTLWLGPIEEGEITIEAGGLDVALDALTASRADGARIDLIETPQGRGFKIDNPNAPQGVNQMGVEELARRIDSGEGFELLDVRTPEERATASIPGAVLLTPEVAKRLESLPRDAMLVFHCHHGGRSQAAAEHFSSLGFTNVWNVSGGIDAWSQQVDPSVPRY